jgi:membrane protein YdbS with pleckstrin-like domain
MRMQEMLDSTSIVGIFLVFAVVSLVVYEIGYRIGRWWQTRTPEEVGGPTGMLVGSLLALMAFMLAITMGMAADRFDTRRGLVLEEANSIGTTYLRAGYLPEPASTQSRELLREYVPLRIVEPGIDVATTVRERIGRSNEITTELWSIAEDLARIEPQSVVLGLYIDSLNGTIDVNETRIIAGVYARVPETVLALLVIGSVLTLGMVGYGAGLTRRRSPLTAIVMIVVLGAVITLVIDLDRPQGGFLNVSQQPLLDLRSQVEPPSS